ncbi:hypothetical protein [Paenibacillus silviterrae]|uniref:hypothetical protein n=1 Tax=Paenibacillus silviterrae TaxID=3242194 RepID=UPI002542FC47|nr:hypothetical protein [Paenibacillus chinjuensis]
MSYGLPNDFIELSDHYVLRVQATADGAYEGQVIMLNPARPGTGTHLFQVQAEPDVSSLTSAAQQGLRALHEG